mgnify:FL=1
MWMIVNEIWTSGSQDSILSTIHPIIQNDIYQAVHFSSSTAAWTDPRGSGADIPDGEIPPKVLRALLCSISLFPSAERYLKDHSNHFEVHLELKSSFKLQDFVATIRKLGIRIDDIEANPAYLNSGLSVYTVSLTVDSQELKKDKKHSDIIEALRSLDYIYYIEEIK